MKITVTQEHIDRGIQRVPRSCPLALAISEASGYDAEVLRERVFLLGSFFLFDDRFAAIAFSGVLHSHDDFIDAYDSGRRVFPFAFTLDLPNAWEQ